MRSVIILATLLFVTVTVGPKADTTTTGQGGALVPTTGSPIQVSALAPRHIAMGDFNEDGHLDLVTANVDSSSVSLLLGDGAGGFTAAAGSPVRTVDPIFHHADIEAHPQAIAVGDFNNDGHLDVVTADPAFIQGMTGGVSVLLGDGAGGLAAVAGTPMMAGGFDPTAIAVGDFNGDGNADLAVTISTFGSDRFTYRNEVLILLGRGDGSFDAADPIVDRELQMPCLTDPGKPCFPVPPSVKVGDLNGDGRDDVVIASVETNDVSVWLGDGTAHFTAAAGSPFAIGRPVDTLALGDFNEDGHIDVAVANALSGSVSVLLGDGAGRLAAAPGSPFAVPTDAVGLAVGDVNGDGHADMVTAGTNQNTISVLLGDGTGGFANGWSSPTAVGSGPQSLVAGRFNGDGRDDVAVANVMSNDVTVLLSVADTTPPTITLATPPDGALYTPLQIVKADYSCQDEAGGSGIASCAGDVTSGNPINTSGSIGSGALLPVIRSFSVFANDRAGNLRITTHSYTIEFASITPASFSFGNQGVNTTSAAQTATVTNISRDPLTIDAIRILGDFFFSPGEFSFSPGTSCPVDGGTLAGGASCVLKIAFTPSNTATVSGYIGLTLNGLLDIQKVTLDGTGVVLITADSIRDAVRQSLQSGAIKNAGEANSLLAKLNAAAAARAAGNCALAASLYQAFINELNAQSGKGVDAAAAAALIADAQYLIAHCP